jgi:hypothetical protein
VTSGDVQKFITAESHVPEYSTVPENHANFNQFLAFYIFAIINVFTT